MDENRLKQQRLPEKSFCYIDDLVNSQIQQAILESSQYLSLSKSVQQQGRQSKQDLLAKLKSILFKKLLFRYELTMSNIFTFILFIWTLFYSLRHSRFFAISFPDREAPLPSPFFNNTNGLIKDFFDGDFSEFEVLRFKAEFTIIMLYSPWDFRSKNFRSSFLDVADIFKEINTVKFIAVNCHYYKGRCRSMFKLLAFPVIFAQTQYNQPIVFNQMLSSDRLYSWIINLLNPFIILKNEDDISKFISSFDFVVIGHFEFFFISSKLPRSYNIFVNSAYLNNNRRSLLSYGLILNKTLASNLNISLNQLNFYSIYSTNLLNSSSFLINSTHKTSNINEWISQCISKFEQKIVSEIEIEDAENPEKSDVLFKKLNSSSLNLILFTNLSGFKQSNELIIAFKNIAKLINNCSPSNLINFKNFKNQDFNSINGLNCKLNQTIGFLILNKIYKNYYISKWGGINNSDQNDLISLISMKDEKIYFLQKNDVNKDLNINSIAQFISNFLNSTLEWLPKNEKLLLPFKNQIKGKSILNKINFEFFNEKILKQENRPFDVVIFFSGGKWHGPSLTILHIFHQVKYYFNNYEEHIKFYLFDTSKNSLPWAYKFNQLPVIGFFPAYIPNDSNLFPSNLALTLPNLIGFLLPRFKQLLKWQLAFDLCITEYCLNKNLKNIEFLFFKIKQDLLLFERINYWRRRRKNEIIIKYIKRLRFQKSILIKIKELLISSFQNINNQGYDFKRTKRKNILFLFWLLEKRNLF